MTKEALQVAYKINPYLKWCPACDHFKLNNDNGPFMIFTCEICFRSSPKDYTILEVGSVKNILGIDDCGAGNMYDCQEILFK